MNYFKMEHINKIDFYKLYKELFNNEEYKKIKSNAKWVYIILLDNLDVANIDDDGNLYLTIREQLQKMLNVSINTMTTIFKELSNVGLLLDIKQGTAKTTLIYPLRIKNINFQDVHKNDDSAPIICEPRAQEKIDLALPKVIIENFTDDDVTKAKDEIRTECLEKVRLTYRCLYDINSYNFCENDKEMLKIAIKLIMASSNIDYIGKKIINTALLECKKVERKK